MYKICIIHVYIYNEIEKKGKIITSIFTSVVLIYILDSKNLKR